MPQQVLAVLRQAEPAGGAMEQPHAEMRLELVHQPGHAGLAGVGLARHGGERAGLGDPPEDGERADQVHDFTDLRIIPLSIDLIIWAVAGIICRASVERPLGAADDLAHLAQTGE